MLCLRRHDGRADLVHALTGRGLLVMLRALLIETGGRCEPFLIGGHWWRAALLRHDLLLLFLWLHGCCGEYLREEVGVVGRVSIVTSHVVVVPGTLMALNARSRTPFRRACDPGLETACKDDFLDVRIYCGVDMVTH